MNDVSETASSAQGYKLSPLLFMLLINNFHSWHPFVMVVVYADDLAMYEQVLHATDANNPEKVIGWPWTSN